MPTTAIMLPTLSLGDSLTFIFLYAYLYSLTSSVPLVPTSFHHQLSNLVQSSLITIRIPKMCNFYASFIKVVIDFNSSHNQAMHS